MIKMKATYFKKHGTLGQLQYGYLETPRPSAREVLIRVHATALNHLDIWTLQGMPGLKIPTPHVMGCDIAGEVAGFGKSVKGLKKGRRVVIAPGIRCGKCEYCKSDWDSLCPQYKILGFQTNGGYAEYVKVPEENVIPVSSKLSYDQWASIPLVFLTAWHMVVTLAKLKKGETILIHAAGSGVGSAAIQIAKHVGARVITTVGSESKMKKAASLGANFVINYKKHDFAQQVQKFTRNRGADVVIDHIGPDTLPKSLLALAKKGRLVNCGVTTGPIAQVNLRFIFSRHLSIIGAYMGSLKELKKVIRLFEDKKLKPIVDSTFPLREASKALSRMMARENFGKIILNP